VTWPRASLKRLSSLGPQYGANAPAVARSGKRPRYVRITDISSDGRLLTDGAVEAELDDESEFALEEGDLLFARSGNTVGKTYCYTQADGPCVFAGYLIRFRPNRAIIEPRFVFYFTQSEPYRRWLDGKRRIAGQPNINGAEYSSLVLPVPTTREQKHIVELLEQADALRRQRAEADALAARILPALFQRMFGDAARNERAWPVEPLRGSLAAIESGQSPTCESRPARSEEWGVLKLGAVTSNRYLDSENKALPAALTPEAQLEVKKGDLLFSRKNTVELVGACAFVFETRPRLLLPDLIFRFRLLDNAQVHPLFLWGLLTARNMRPAIQALAGGSAGSMPNISKGRLEGLMIQKPPFSLQKRFADFVERVHENAVPVEATRANLERLFQTMLHRAFTGKLTDRWREAHMEELLAEMEQQARYLNTDGATL
jgi:type I restriction enzyme, S subunit